MATALKLSMNQILFDLSKLSVINSQPEIKRLLAMAITDIEHGTVMAVKAMFTEGFQHARPEDPFPGKAAEQNQTGE